MLSHSDDDKPAGPTKLDRSTDGDHSAVDHVDQSDQRQATVQNPCSVIGVARKTESMLDESVAKKIVSAIPRER